MENTNNKKFENCHTCTCMLGDHEYLITCEKYILNRIPRKQQQKDQQKKPPKIVNKISPKIHECKYDLHVHEKRSLKIYYIYQVNKSQ